RRSALLILVTALALTASAATVFSGRGLLPASAPAAAALRRRLGSAPAPAAAALLGPARRRGLPSRRGLRLDPSRRRSLTARRRGGRGLPPCSRGRRHLPRLESPLFVSRTCGRRPPLGRRRRFASRRRWPNRAPRAGGGGRRPLRLALTRYRRPRRDPSTRL